MSTNSAYYAARAAQEREVAMASADPKVRSVHLELAAKYAILASPPSEPESVLSEPEQKTA